MPPALPPSPANSSAVNTAHLKDGKNGHRSDKALEGGDSSGLHPAFPGLSSRPFPHGERFRIPGRDQSGSRGEQGVRGAWAGLEAGQGRGWWGSVDPSLRNTESLLGERFEAANGLGL